MKTTVYTGVAYRQASDQDASWIISFVAAAEDVLEWAGIPRRTTDDEMAGFQRAYDESRVSKAKAFFEIPANQSPTALVIGFHPNHAAHSSGAKLEFLSEDGNIRPCKLTIKTPDFSKPDEILPLIKAQIDYRLSQSEISNTETEKDDEITEDDTIAEQAEDSDDLELGRSLLVRLRKHLDDVDWVTSNMDALQDLAKPATVIDGQHRLKGAERCERGIPFTICGLFDCQWSEQVFQFTVINYTQEGIPDQFITSNAALSLTQVELGQLQDRLVQAGVNVLEYELMKIVHFHDDSPFKSLVNLTEDKKPSLIGYKTMVRLAKVWFDGRQQAFKLVLPNLYPDIKTNNKERLKRWKQDDWGLFFLDFWREVYSTYKDSQSHVAGHTLWDVGHSNLIVAIVLFELQQAFLNSLAQQDEEYFITKSSEPELARKELREKVIRRAKKFLEWFPADFFSMKWGQSSLSIGPGRKALRDCFDKLVLQKGDYRYAAASLVTGQT